MEIRNRMQYGPRQIQEMDLLGLRNRQTDAITRQEDSMKEQVIYRINLEDETPAEAALRRRAAFVRQADAYLRRLAELEQAEEADRELRSRVHYELKHGLGRGI